MLTPSLWLQFFRGAQALGLHVPGSAFIRCMVLDAELLGRPTFRAWDAGEAAKPRSTASRLFFDTLTGLDAA